MSGFSVANWGGMGATSPVITAGDMSANLSGIASALAGTTVGLQLVWTGTPTGSFSVDMSNDYVAGVNNGTWEDITSALSLPALTGSAGQFFQAIVNYPAGSIRVRYTKSSGSGTLNVTASFKG